MLAQNVIWVLVEAKHLCKASLQFIVPQASFEYLYDLRDTFKRLSNLKQLAILPRFLWEKSSDQATTWAGNREIICRNAPTEAIYSFLQVTKQLDSLEIVGGQANSYAGDEAFQDLFIDCLAGISTSHKS